jgi:hypothetical protein
MPANTALWPTRPEDTRSSIDDRKYDVQVEPGLEGCGGVGAENRVTV